MRSINERLSIALIGASALVVVLAPTSAEAAPCSYLVGPSFAYYEECTQSIGAVGAVAGTLVDTSSSITQQQINAAMGLGLVAGPTGRIRHTTHDGLVDKQTGNRSQPFTIGEGSVFANATYDLDRPIFGGKVRLSGLIGYDQLDAKSKGGATSPYSTSIDALMFGGSYLWSKGSFYTMSLIIAFDGELESNSNTARFSHDLFGYTTNSVVGNTFDLGWGRFDLRAGLGRYDVQGDRFNLPFATDVKSVISAWNTSLTGTLFQIVNIEGGTVMRPYMLGAYRYVFDEEIAIKGTTSEFDQASHYGRFEVGVDLVRGPMTFGTSAYADGSSDEHTFGARFGASYKLQ